LPKAWQNCVAKKENARPVWIFVNTIFLVGVEFCADARAHSFEKEYKKYGFIPVLKKPTYD